MAKRKGLSKKVRFEVFKRDGFVCGYCGSSPPAVVLEVDHIEAVANGGDNSMDNLITACFDCNRGKSANDLHVVSQSLQEKALLMAEKEGQLKAYKNLKSSIKRRITRETNKIEKVFNQHFKDKRFSDNFRVSVKTFLLSLDADLLSDNMHKACSFIDNPEKALKYFCGINWRMIKGGGNG